MGVVDGAFGVHEQVEIAATDVSATARFTDLCNKVMVLNRDAANAVYVELGATTATVASGIRVGPDRELVFPVESRDVAAVCESGQSATVQFVGLR